MLWFLGGIAFLILGYFTYGRFVERVVAPDDRPTPAIECPDGVDYVPLPKWKNELIQLLNIAGVGPVIGVIAGIKFGKVALLIIPLGCVFAGAVHDFLGGMASIRDKGANLPKIIRDNLGRGYASVFSWFMVGLLLLVVAVFINVPSNLIKNRFFGPEANVFWWIVGVIFLYYIAATLFPVDKIIGRVYPFFGALLLLGSFALLIALVRAGFKNPEILNESAEFLQYKEDVFNAHGRAPLFPLLFVTIACGIISGFHATQSPIVARTMKSEREARATFYGMMIAEGVIAMVWAAAALAQYNLQPADLKLPPPVVLVHITTRFLGSWMGAVTVLAVVVLAVTSGDTALRSTRLSLAEQFHVPQAALASRLSVSLPLIVLTAALLWWSNKSAESFNHLWNYFAWGNQVLSASTLMACTVWLLRRGHRCGALVALIPGMFMTSVVTTFILWTSPAYGQPHGLFPNGLSLHLSFGLSIALAVVFAVFVFVRGRTQIKK